jgi:hypothetical protein
MMTIADTPATIVEMPLFEVREPRVLKAASWLTGWTMHWLPVAHRVNYEERFRGELYFLAKSGCGWFEQVGHALRVLAGAPRLRNELRGLDSPVGSSDGNY